MDIKKKALMALAVIAIAPITTACIPPACENLTVTAQDLEAAANGYEVERTDVHGNECELSRDGLTWSVDS